MQNKFTLLLLSILIVLSLSSCSSDRAHNDMPSNSENIITLSSSPTEFTAIETTVSSESTHEDNEALDIIVNECGYPFRFYCPVDMDLYEFQFYESYARREYSSFYIDGMIEHDDLDWEIIGYEMIVSGDWNERFTIDLDSLTATSQTDGMVYRIVSDD